MRKTLIATALLLASVSYATSLNYLMGNRTKLNLRCALDINKYDAETSFSIGVQKLDENLPTQRIECGVAYYYSPVNYNNEYGIRFYQKNLGSTELEFMPGRRSKNFDICTYEVLNRNSNPMYLTAVVTDVLLTDDFQRLKSAKVMLHIQKRNANTDKLSMVFAGDYYCEEEPLIVKFPPMQD